MIAFAKGKYLRISPMKMNQVISLIRGKDVVTSLALLEHVNKGATEKIVKVLESAVSNAKQKGLTEDQLFVSKIVAERGPHWKRFRAASFGSSRMK